ncbi:MAG TPA: hypothetical protein VGN24_05920 [Rhodanobacter sp.]|jgi:TolB-like protein|nr:hypothetical protein [Rhodanobacter sp.]
MTEFLQRLKQRKLVQWALAYVAAAFALIQVVDVVAQRFGWPDRLEKLIILALAVGFFVVLVIAWYHGDKGRQRVSGAELLLIALVLAVGGGLLWRFARAPSNAVAVSVSALAQAIPIPAKSIAVLPFENLSGDSKQAYFSEGITEEILNALAQIPDLKVSGRTSAFQFNSKDENLRQIGTTLGVADVLVGSVQKAGDEVRINVQLIDAHTGYQRWSEKYDRKLTNIFAIEDDISSAVAGKLRVQLAGAAGQALVVQKAIDPRAHDFYLRGLALLAARGPGLRDAVTAFQSAVKIDPQYAEAWGALAETETLLPAYWLDTMEAVLPRAQSAARRAIMLDPATPLAHVALGNVYSDRWQWADADRAFRRALALAPGDAETIDQYAQFLLVVGQFDAALSEIERAQQIDPLSAVIGANRAHFLIVLHRYDDAETQIEQTLAMHPDFALAHTIAAVLDIDRHRYVEAEVQMRLAAPFYGGDPNAFVQLVRGMADPVLRSKVVGDLETSPAYAALRRDPIVHAMYLTWLGQTDRALDVLELFVVKRNSNQPQTLWSPTFDPIRNDPRFKAVLKKMGLPYKPPETAAP